MTAIRPERTRSKLRTKDEEHSALVGPWRAARYGRAKKNARRTWPLCIGVASMRDSQIGRMHSPMGQVTLAPQQARIANSDKQSKMEIRSLVAVFFRQRVENNLLIL